MKTRRCSKTGCARVAVATLTFVYSDSMAVVGPLALRAEPGTYDLCAAHSSALSTPRGWEPVRLPLDEETPGHSSDDLMALAEAVREVGFGLRDPARPQVTPPSSVGRRKGHLSVVADLP